MTQKMHSAALIGAAVLSLFPALAAQDAPPPGSAKPEPAAPGRVDPRSNVDLIEQLGAERPDDRRDAEQVLRQRGAAAREVLENAAEGHEDPEVRWRARRILRALDGQAQKLERPAPRTEPRHDRDDPDAGQDPDTGLNEALERIHRSFGEPGGAWKGFGELEARMKDLQRQMDELQRGFEQGPGLGLPGGAIARGSKLQLGPDGVRVEIQEPKAGGGTETKTYEAPDLDAFREQHPEIAQQFFGSGTGTGFHWFGGRSLPAPGGAWRQALPGLRLFRGGELGQPEVEVDSPMEFAPPAPGERLGVRISELDPAVRRFLGIEEGVGILVESIEADSLAANLGIQVRDVVTQIGEQAIHGPVDVRAALGRIAQGEPVTVTVNRKGEVTQLKGTKLEAEVSPRKLEPVSPTGSGDADAPTRREPDSKRR